MGRHKLVDKIEDELNKGITTEAQVVYVLVEVRKLMEITDQSAKYPVLSFYCDWALHSRMDRSGALRILQYFDTYCDKCIRDPIEGAELSTEIDGIIGGEHFREELAAFLKSVHISAILELPQWFVFLELYSRVIIDTPLTIRRQRKGTKVNAPVTITHLKSIVVKARKDETMAYLDWQLYYQTYPPPPFSPGGCSIGFGIRVAS
jgi:hypothetical protein